MVKPGITVARKSGSKAMLKRVAGLTRVSAYVGIPASKAERDKALLAILPTAHGKRKKLIQKALGGDINNAEVLFVFSKGSPIRGQEARPVLEPAMAASDNAEKISREMGLAIQAGIRGDRKTELKYMRRAALAGQNAARKWFTDPRNGWAPNAPATIAAKGSDRPGINTGALRSAIIGLVEEQ